MYIISDDFIDASIESILKLSRFVVVSIDNDYILSCSSSTLPQSFR